MFLARYDAFICLLAVCKSPEPGIKTVAEEGLRSCLEAMRARKARKRSTARFQEMRDRIGLHISADIETTQSESEGQGLRLRSRGINSRVSRSGAGGKDAAVRASSRKRHHGNGRAQFVFKGQARPNELGFKLLRCAMGE